MRKKIKINGQAPFSVRLKKKLFRYTDGTRSWKEEFGLWYRRHKHQVAGVVLLAVLVTVGVLGYRSTHPGMRASSDGGGSYEDYLEEQNAHYNSLGLSYEVSFEGLDGEMFTYSLYFDPKPGEEETARIVDDIFDRISEKQGQDDSAYYGDIFPYTTDDGYIMIVLDLGNADDDRMVEGILHAMDGTEGLTQVVINEGAAEYYDEFEE